MENMEKKIKKQIADFFGRKRFVYAIPCTDNHSANFYGDSRICRLSRQDIMSCIDCASGWNNEFTGKSYTRLELASIILEDMQHYKPE